jgi:hypothetical protein
MYSKGGNHFLAAIRRNIDMTLLANNNQVYGLTKGQASPTSDEGFVTKGQPEGVAIAPFNPVAVAVAMHAGFVARGFVGAYLANLVNEAALLAARKNKDMGGSADFDEAIDRVVGGLQKKNRVMNVQEKKIVAFHESGHAIVAEPVEHADPVHKISRLSCSPQLQLYPEMIDLMSRLKVRENSKWSW